MTVCERVQRHDIHLYLDNELSPADVLELEKIKKLREGK